MNILLIGSGGREHALGWALRKSPRLGALYCAPGNGGIADIARCVDLDTADHGALIRFCAKKGIDLVVIGPEVPLVAGLADDLEAAGIKAFGPSAAAARLEGSKSFTKALCAANAIPTAASRVFANGEEARAYIAYKGAPIVLKADGLAAGKGVIVAMTDDEALAGIDRLTGGGFGAAADEIVIEEYLQGEEASFFALVDGETVLPLATAQDHKRVGDGDTGPNTGGMGACSPAPVMSEDLCRRTMDEIINPTVRAMAAAGTPFRGVLYAGLMITDAGPQLIEYNVRFGDPECQVLMMRLKSDLLGLLAAVAEGNLGRARAEWRDECALTIVMAANGYPGCYETGTPIRGLEEAGRPAFIEIFHAGTRREGRRLLAQGGRVLNVTALGSTVAEAQARARVAVERVDWPGGFSRRDIGWRAIERERKSGT